MTVTKAKSINGKACIEIKYFNSLEWAIIIPVSARYKLGQRGFRYVCTDYEISNHDIYEKDGEIYAIPTGKGY